MDQATQTDLPLRDIHLPEAISWWPPAPGWWFLLVGVILLIVIFFLIKKIRQRKQLQKTALAELKKICSNYESDNNKKTLARSLSVLLRRASISFYPRNNMASLTGEQWLQHLDNTADKKGFKTSDGHILITAPYLPDDHNENINADSLISLCESWIRAQPRKLTSGEQL